MNGDVFSFPKDEEIIGDMIESFANDDSFILDFFLALHQQPMQ